MRRILNELRASRSPVRFPRPLAVGGWLALLAFAVISPLVSAPFVNFERSMVLVYLVVGLGLNLLTGNTGQLSLGHGAFFAFGAYLTAGLTGGGVSYVFLIPITFCGGFVLGYLVGRPALRFQGLQLALVTLGLALVTPAVIKRFDSVTKGHNGLNLDTAEPPAWLAIDRDQWVYYVCLACAVVAFIVTKRIGTGRTGRALVGIRDHETVASTLGVRTATAKTKIFAFSAAYASTAGMLYAFVVQFVGPDAFGISLAITFITLIVVGGLGAPAGALFGALFVQYAPSITISIDQSASGLAYGASLILFIYFLPNGILGFIRYVLHAAQHVSHAPRKCSGDRPQPELDVSGSHQIGVTR